MNSAKSAAQWFILSVGLAVSRDATRSPTFRHLFSNGATMGIPVRQSTQAVASCFTDPLDSSVVNDFSVHYSVPQTHLIDRFSCASFDRCSVVMWFLQYCERKCDFGPMSEQRETAQKWDTHWEKRNRTVSHQVYFRMCTKGERQNKTPPNR